MQLYFNNIFLNSISINVVPLRLQLIAMSNWNDGKMLRRCR